jgi:hypothetical protein
MIHIHRYQVVGVDRYQDVSFGQPGIPFSRVRRVCLRCSKPRTKNVKGHWSLADLRPAA